MNFYAASALINFITSSVLGVFVISKGRNSKNVGFFTFCFFVAFWSFFYFIWQISKDSTSALFWARALMAGAIFIPVAYLHFVYALVGLIEKRKNFLILSYGLFGLFLLSDFTPYFISHVEPVLGFEFWPIAGPIYSLFLLVWFFYVIYSTFLLYQKYRNSSGIIRLQIKYVILGMVVGFAGGSTNYFLWYKIPVLPVANILVSVYVGSIAYAIIRYRLMDIRIVARKIFIYIGVAAFAYGIFYSLTWFYNKFFGGVFANTALAFGLIMAPLFAMGFYSIDKWMRVFANKYLFVSLYNYQETLNRLADELTNYIDLDKIIGLIVDTIKDTMKLDRAGVLLVNTEVSPTYYQIAKVIGFNESNGISLVQDSFLTKYLSKTQKPLVSEELLILSSDAKSKKDRQNFAKLYDHMNHIEASLCLPLMSNKKLIGIIVLGPKASGDAYTKEDLDLLNTLSKQAGITIENARQHKQIQEFGKTLQAKVDEQTKDLQNTNKELEVKNQLNQELLTMKSDFLRVVNHQLNTPVSIMSGYFSLMKEGDYSPEKALPVIELGLQRINRTVADFWDAYELEGERMRMNPERVDITTVVEKMVIEKRDLQYAKDRKLTLSVDPPKFKVPIVWCDIKKIAHVISNLLDNAVFYTEHGGIVVSYELTGDYLKINIKDTGHGISEEDRKKIFQKFSRGAGASGMHPDGSGLGLYISKKIIEGNGGEISFESEGVGKGTTLSFTVPVYIGQQAGSPGEVVTRENKIEIFI